MSELNQLKDRINKAGPEGVSTAQIRDDYEPAGDLMMMRLMDAGEYVQRKVPAGSWGQKWYIFKTTFAPY